MWLTDCEGSAGDVLCRFRGFKAPDRVHCVPGWPSNFKLVGYRSHFSLVSSYGHIMLRKAEPSVCRAWPGLATWQTNTCRGTSSLFLVGLCGIKFDYSRKLYLDRLIILRSIHTCTHTHVQTRFSPQTQNPQGCQCPPDWSWHSLLSLSHWRTADEDEQACSRNRDSPQWVSSL